MLLSWFKQFLWASSLFVIILAAQATQSMLSNEYQAFQSVQDSQKMAQTASFSDLKTVF